MEYPLSTELSSEVRQIMRNHISRLSPYATLIETNPSRESQELVMCLETLSQICRCPPESSPCTSYEEALQYLTVIDEFLKLMCQQKDSAFYKTHVGRICAQADQWCQAVTRQFNSSIDDVWKLIEPAVPDSLSEIQDSLYEAKWWKPVPLMDIEILKRTERVVVCGDPYEPSNLRKGLAVRFSVITEESENSNFG